MDELINISCRLADAAGYAAFPRCEVTPYEQLLDELPARERSRFHADQESLIIEVRGKIEALECLALRLARFEYLKIYFEPERRVSAAGAGFFT